MEADVIPARALTYYFYNDTLVGEEFISSVKSDNSNFDDKQVEGIKKGQTTRAEVTKLLGEPTATFIPPMVKETSGEAIGYTYQGRGGLFSGIKNFVKVLRFSLMTKVWFQISSTRPWTTSEFRPASTYLVAGHNQREAL